MLSKKVLIIDDDPDFVAILKTRLTTAGYEVSSAGNGREGFSQIIISDPDLIILDVIMPIMNGFQFMEKYRENAKLHKIPVFVVTAKKSMREFFMDMPIKDFITKPLDMAAFMAQIDKAMGKKGPSSVSQAIPSTVASPVPSAAAKRLLLVAVDKFIEKKIAEFFKTSGWEVTLAKNDSEAYETAKTLYPDAILCQYWNPAWEGSALDTKSLGKRLAEEHSLARIHFQVYCTHGPLLGAMEIFPESQLIKYDESSDLLKSIAKRFGIYQ